MSGGRQRHVVAFDARATSSDGESDNLGRVEGEFQEQFTRHAEFVPRFGGEEVMASRLAGRQPVTIIVRKDSETRQITSDWRVRELASGDIYNIRSIVDPEQRRGYRDLLCEKGVQT